MAFATDAGATQAGRPILRPERPLRSGAPGQLYGWGAAFTMAAGGALTGSLLAATLVLGSTGAGHQLQPIGKDELAAASSSLLPTQAAGLVEQAESCRAPLASLTIGNAANGTVRIRSGAYLSPSLQLGPQPTRIAVPYPEPYAAGRGRIVVESATEGVDLFLSPGHRIGGGRRSTVIDVRWNPNAPCRA